MPFRRVLGSILWVVLAAAVLPPSAPAQDQTPSQSPAQPTQPIPPPDKPQQPDQSPPPDQPEVKITPRQAEELFHSVDEILEFDSKQTGLPIKHTVKRKLTSRDEVVSYLTKHVNDEDTRRLRRSELVLKKFGLLPRDFDLQTFLVALLKEEIAGYYDPKTKTVNLLDWVPIEEQEPVMAHELTHALQDQDINLTRWMKRGDKDLGEIRKDPTPEDIENDEIDNAREAVLEGQAQAIMFQYAIAPTGHSIATSPELVKSMEEETLTGTSSTKVFNDAPIFMRESLTFPYSYGMNFIIELLQKGGKDRAFAALLQNPPHTTRQIMEPQTYLSGEKIPPMSVPDFKHDFKDYLKFDIGAMGEFDVALLLEQYAGKAVSNKIYPEWRGGYYYAAKAKTNADAPLGLLYVSRWSSPESAAEFAGVYAQSLKQRYKNSNETNPSQLTPSDSRSTASQVPDPQLTDSQLKDNQRKNSQPKDSELKEDSDHPALPRLTGRHTWSTDEGTVVIEEKADTVFVSESLDAATTAALEKEVLSASAAK